MLFQSLPDADVAGEPVPPKARLTEIFGVESVALVSIIPDRQPLFAGVALEQCFKVALGILGVLLLWPRFTHGSLVK